MAGLIALLLAGTAVTSYQQGLEAGKNQVQVIMPNAIQDYFDCVNQSAHHFSELSPGTYTVVSVLDDAFDTALLRQSVPTGDILLVVRDLPPEMMQPGACHTLHM